MDYEVKHVLKNYDHYVKIIEELKNKKREIAANQLKTGGSVIKMPDKNAVPKNKQIDYIMAKDRIQKRIDAYRFIFSIADDFMKSVPPSSRELVYYRFIKQMSYEELAKKYNYSQRHIHRKINRLIERYVDKR